MTKRGICLLILLSPGNFTDNERLSEIGARTLILSRTGCVALAASTTEFIQRGDAFMVAAR